MPTLASAFASTPDSPQEVVEELISRGANVGALDSGDETAAVRLLLNVWIALISG